MARKPLKTPYDDEDGFTSAKVHPRADGYLVLYDGVEAGFDIESGKWSLFCTAHGSIGTETSRARATKLLATPEHWCSACKRDLATSLVQLRTMSFETPKTPEATEREMRFWAKKSKNSPEKQMLFEKMFGVSPDQYWD